MWNNTIINNYLPLLWFELNKNHHRVSLLIIYGLATLERIIMHGYKSSTVLLLSAAAATASAFIPQGAPISRISTTELYLEYHIADM